MLKEPDYQECIQGIYEWMDKCIPAWSQLGSNQGKITEEMREWLADPNDEELADVFITIIFDARQRGIDFPEMIKKKLQVLHERRWVWVEEAGVYHHAFEP